MPRREEEARRGSEKRKREEEARRGSEKRKREEEARRGSEKRKREEEARRGSEKRKREEEARRGSEKRKREEEARRGSEKRKRKMLNYKLFKFVFCLQSMFLNNPQKVFWLYYLFQFEIEPTSNTPSLMFFYLVMHFLIINWCYLPSFDNILIIY
ncbi:hypothetical protein EIN_394630 [Entamoeba invadens IP1]|uniref:Uncharacterized protein n=1 Tax=Entamoeba invadens IP1 TaxID=370355 RepID=L7FMX1_ENTIV|nr:hypothetical protein EIN_394630 [Entamoeba invadens IP1]ELP90246.1 hypothetical protein EIN_394630 [Entamoeba invadens IP1]|eukprot:XP_004257017.1 hypothetical protein EIN_394630 [Entamoeba invadens IP1]